MLKVAVVVFLAGCVALVHIPPRPRNVRDQSMAVALVESDCGDGGVSGWASGVVVSARHVVTAAHVVGCAGLPDVHVTVAGRRYRAVVERDERMFGDGRDLARLEIASAEYFDLRVDPPALDYARSVNFVCAYSAGRNYTCGYVSADPRLVAFRTYPGDSGAPVYDMASGNLVGIVIRGGGYYSTIEYVDSSWLAGT